jgi:putative peptidoglycan lipid II flippase
LLTAGINVVLYIGIGTLLYRPLGAAGIALTDSVVFTLEALLLFLLLGRRMERPLQLGNRFWRPLAALTTAAGVTWLTQTWLSARTSPWVAGTLPLLLGLVTALPWIWKEMRTLAQL